MLCDLLSSKVQGDYENKGECPTRKAPVIHWEIRTAHVSTHQCTTGHHKQSTKSHEDREEGDWLPALREVQQRGNQTLKKRDLTWVKVNQMSSLEARCGKPGGSWARDHITGMCFRKVTWQQCTDLRMDGSAGDQHSISKNSYSYFTKSNVLGSDGESKKEATTWLAERVSHLGTQGGTTQTVEMNHSLKLFHPNYPWLPRTFKHGDKAEN